MSLNGNSTIYFQAAKKADGYERKATRQQKRDNEIRWSSQKLFDANGNYVGEQKGTHSWEKIVKKRFASEDEDTFVPAELGKTKAIVHDSDDSSYRQRVEEEQARHREQALKRSEEKARKEAEKTQTENRNRLKRHVAKAERAWNAKGDGFFTPGRINQVTILSDGHTGTAEDHNLFKLGFRENKPGLHTKKSLEGIREHVQGGLQQEAEAMSPDPGIVQKATDISDKIASLLNPTHWPPR
ncbi:MAG: hypothetical protein K0Q50_2954 [Vampirovibrio sp.]|jgi:hypothetical protein|nr:hypothetical protein [Vampirovibrio sp.]